MSQTESRYFIRPFHGQTDGSRGYDVWERTGQSEVVVVPCQTQEQAQAELEILQERDRARKIVGYTHPLMLANMTRSKPGGFLLLLLDSLTDPQMAVTDEGPDANDVGYFSRKVESFSFVHASRNAPIPAELAHLQISIGDTLPFGFECSDGKIVIGQYAEIADVVRREFPLFKDCPFTQQELADFLRDTALQHEATENVRALLNSEKAGAGDKYVGK